MHGKRGAVLVCVDNLPPGISRKALKRFVQQAVDQGRGTWLADAGQALGIAVRDCPAGTDAAAINRPPPGSQVARRNLRLTSNIADCAILRVTDQYTGEESYRGLVAIRPAKCALTVIAVLDGLEVAGFRLHARRFQHHSEPHAISTILNSEAWDGASPAHLARPAPCALELVAATPAASRPSTPTPNPVPNSTPVSAQTPAPMPARSADPTPTTAHATATKPAPTKPGPTKVDPPASNLDTAADGRAFAH